MAEYMGSAIKRTISVCDRESDVYEYLLYKLREEQRFVVCAQVNRRVLHSDFKLFEALECDASALCCYTVQIPQRGRGQAGGSLLRTTLAH
jgi:hypothetical protein